MTTRRDHPLKDTTVCHLQEDTTSTSIPEETMGEMIGSMAGLLRGVDLTPETPPREHPWEGPDFDTP